MENDAGVSELVELVFGKRPTMPEERVAHSSIPSNVLNEDFLKKFEDLLRMQKFIIYDIWRSYFDCSYREMLSSHQQYLQKIMFACLYIHEFNRNIFHSFISVFLLVVNISNEVLTKARIDFRDLNPDIIMVFYRNLLKSSFPKLGGFYGFVEYVRGHKYFEWNWDENDLNLSDGETVFDNFRPDLDENIVKECDSYLNFMLSEGMGDTIDATAMCMAQEVLSTSSVELPILPSEYDLIKRLVAYKKQLANKTDRKRRVEATSALETSHGDLSSNSFSKSNYVEEQQENVEHHENIIEAVIRHNRFNISRHNNVINQKQLEAEYT